MGADQFPITLIMKPIKVIVFIVLFTAFAVAEIDLYSSGMNNTSSAKIELGRFLFYDTKLSYNNTKSCSSCHDPKYAFSDGYRRSSGADGYAVRRNAPSLINTKFLTAYTWGDSSIHRFESQLIFPFFNDDPKELGWRKNDKELLLRFLASPVYQRIFQKAFPTQKQPINIQNIFTALIAFENQLVSFNAPYDAFLKGNKYALNEQAQKGMSLFYSEKLACGACHIWQQANPVKPVYANTGLYNIDGKNNYPDSDEGLFIQTGNIADKGFFRVPSLRNILLTAPYTHDGSVATIDELIRIYERGGRKIITGVLAGDGKNNRHKSKLIKGFILSDEERLALISFLDAFTDTSFLQKKNLLNPFN
ncbi:MAG: di-heme enzyme [Sphingobacteriia bacterium]|nr:MAG: di-heme enzyme [Sphingobacteriia bacterium]